MALLPSDPFGRPIGLQRFTKALSVYPHLHVLVLDGGYTELEDGTLTFAASEGSSVRSAVLRPFARPRFRGLTLRVRHGGEVEDTAPTPAELRAIEDRVEARFGGWLKRNGFLDEEGPEEQTLNK